MKSEIDKIGKIGKVGTTNEQGEIVERYCPRLDKNVTVYRDIGEKTGYVCSLSGGCEFSHCMMYHTARMAKEVEKSALSAKI